MARKNKQVIRNNLYEYYAQDEKARLEKNKRRNETRLANIKLKEQGMQPKKT